MFSLLLVIIMMFHLLKVMMVVVVVSEVLLMVFVLANSYTHILGVKVVEDLMVMFVLCLECRW